MNHQKRSHASARIRQHVLARLRRGEKVRHLCRDMGISLQTLYNWKKDAANGKHAPNHPRGATPKLTPIHQQRMINYLRTCPKATLDQLWILIGGVVSKNTISKFLGRQHLSRKERLLNQ